MRYLYICDDLGCSFATEDYSEAVAHEDDNYCHFTYGELT